MYETALVRFTLFCVACSFTDNRPSLGFQCIKKSGCSCMVWKVVRGSRWWKRGRDTGKEESQRKVCLQGCSTGDMHVPDSVWTSEECTEYCFCIVHCRNGDCNICLWAPWSLMKWNLSSEALPPPSSLPFWGAATGKTSELYLQRNPWGRKAGMVGIAHCCSRPS